MKMLYISIMVVVIYIVYMVENGDSSRAERRNLIIILVTLLVLAITFVVMIIVFRNNKPEEVGVDDDTVPSSALDGSDDEMYLLYNETSKIYDEGRQDEALDIYTQKIDQALTNGDYEVLLRLVSQRDDLLLQNSDCDRALIFYDTFSADQLPAEIQVQYYGMAAGTSAECGDTAREALYDQKVQQIYNDGKVDEGE